MSFFKDHCSDSGCGWLGYIHRGGSLICVKHYRFRQMIGECRRNHKKMPPVSLLESLVQDMTCRGCKRKMVWTRKEDSKRVMTLQHDRDGSLTLLCQSCNSAHKNFPGDSFYQYDISDPNTFCRWCMTQKTASDFYKSKLTFSGLLNGCKDCRREYYSKRK